MCDRVARTDLDPDELERLESFEASEGIAILEVVRDGGTIYPTLINGKPVPRQDWLQVVRIGNHSCTATLVGPNCALTAAHCGTDGSSGPLEVYNLGSINYKVVQMPQYQNGSNFDLSVLVLDSDVPAGWNVPYATVGVDHTFSNGQDVDILGYGCVRPGGGGGNDGVLRFGESKVTGMTGTDVVTSWRSGGAALCFGDSGGPMMANESNVLVAINSKGNIRDTNYNMRLNLESVNDFLTATANRYDLEMLGITAGGEPDPDPTPPPGNGGDVEKLLTERDQEFADLHAKWSAKFAATNGCDDNNSNESGGPRFGL